VLIENEFWKWLKFWQQRVWDLYLESVRKWFYKGACGWMLCRRSRCYGCTSATVEHCITLLRAMATNPTLKSTLCGQVWEILFCMLCFASNVHNYYLRQQGGGYVIVLSVCLSVCHSVSRITEDVMSRFYWNLVLWLGHQSELINFWWGSCPRCGFQTTFLFSSPLQNSGF